MSTNYPEYRNLDLPGIAREVLETWEREQTFSEALAAREGRPRLSCKASLGQWPARYPSR